MPARCPGVGVAADVDSFYSNCTVMFALAWPLLPGFTCEILEPNGAASSLKLDRGDAAELAMVHGKNSNVSSA